MGAAGIAAQKKAEAEAKRLAEEEERRAQEEAKQKKEAERRRIQKSVEEHGGGQFAADLVTHVGGAADFDFVSSGLVGTRKTASEVRT